MSGVLTGGCLCGGVSYAITGALTEMSHCHCTRCRKMHGAAFATYVTVPRAQFALTRGGELLKTYPVDGGGDRTFCTACGSSLFYGDWADPASDIEVAVGTMDGDPGLRPRMHIHVGSKAPWFEITDDLPQRAEMGEEKT